MLCWVRLRHTPCTLQRVVGRQDVLLHGQSPIMPVRPSRLGATDWCALLAVTQEQSCTEPQTPVRASFVLCIPAECCTGALRRVDCSLCRCQQQAVACVLCRTP